MTVPWMNTEYHAFPNTPGISYSAAARRLMSGAVAFWPTAASAKPRAALRLPLQGGANWCSLHPSLETGLRPPPLCRLRLCSCKPHHLKDHAVLETPAARGPERPLDQGARTTEHTHTGRAEAATPEGGCPCTQAWCIRTHKPALPAAL